MKQRIVKRFAAFFAASCLCAALAPGLALAADEEYQAGSLADGTEVSTQAEGENYVVSVEPAKGLEFYVGEAPGILSASVASTGTINELSSYDMAYQWYSATSDVVPADPATGTKIDNATEATYTPAGLEAGTYYYYCMVTLTKKANTAETTVLASNAATIKVNEKKQVMPTNVEAVNVSLKGEKDGAIVNVTKDMEWRLKTDKKWTACKSTTIEGLGEGTYQVRLKESGTLEPSEPSEFTIGWDATSEVKIGNNAPKVTIPNLGDVALNLKASSDIDDSESVEVDMAVSAIANNSNDGDVAKIKAIATDKNLMYFGLALSKTIGSGKATDITELEGDVLEINVEYTTKDRKNIIAYRVHGDKAEAFKSLSQKPTSDFKDGTFYVGDGTVTIYSSKFSTYALGYDTKGSDEKKQTTPATGDTLPGVVPFVLIAVAAIVAMFVARRFIRKIW